MRTGEDDGALTGLSERGMQAGRIGNRGELAMAKAAEIRGPVGDWHALRANSDYRAHWRKRGVAASVVESGGFMLRLQNEADLDAARWDLLAWEDPQERSGFKPFWIDEGMLEGSVVEPGGSAPPLMAEARAIGISVSGLGLLDGALVLKVRRWRRVEQIRVPEGGSFDMERSALQLRWPLQLSPPAELPRLMNLDAMTVPRKRVAANR